VLNNENNDEKMAREKESHQTPGTLQIVPEFLHALSSIELATIQSEH
jgi:hypothetical protein